MTITGEQLARIALDAGRLIMDIYSTDFEVERKDDASPVTEADAKAACVVQAESARSEAALAAAEHHKASVGPQPCNWTAPVPTSIPDAHTRTHAGSLPDGSVYLLGTQVAVRFSACFR